MFFYALHIFENLSMSQALSYQIGNASKEEPQPSLNNLAQEV